MDALINAQIARQVRDIFQKLHHPVRILFFGQAENCEYCPETRQLLEEAVGLSPLLSMQVFDLQADAEQAMRFGVNKAPGYVITGLDEGEITDYGIRFSGMPFGNEFASLVNSLVLVSTRDSGLSQATRDTLKKLDHRVTLQTFTTPT